MCVNVFTCMYAPCCVEPAEARAKYLIPIFSQTTISFYVVLSTESGSSVRVVYALTSNPSLQHYIDSFSM